MSRQARRVDQMLEMLAKVPPDANVGDVDRLKRFDPERPRALMHESSAAGNSGDAARSL